MIETMELSDPMKSDLLTINLQKKNMSTIRKKKIAKFPNLFHPS